MNRTNEKRVKGQVDNLTTSSVSAECLPEPPPRQLTVALRQVWNTSGRLALGGGILAAGLAGPALGQSFALSDLDGSNGFIINGSHADDSAGRSVSNAGDVNDDGIDDILIGASGANPNGGSSGQSYVVFGSSTGFSSVLELSDLDGSNGFIINGINAGDRASGVSGAGDVNGDGIDDILIGALDADPNGESSGQSYVVFGSSTGFSSVLELSELDGSNGFMINAIRVGDSFGEVSKAGDVNGDGIDDILIGAPVADPNGENSGQSYVVFGSSTGFSSALELSELDGSNGFVLNGINAGDRAGLSVSGAGDANGDGIDDILIGASGADPNGENSGQAYVVFGSSMGFSPVLELSSLDGSNGFVLNGINVSDLAGEQVSGAGDVNDDGLDDVLISAALADANGDSSGQSYVVFGSSTGFNPVLELSDLDGRSGFTINGINDGDNAGGSVSSAGDVNGDGIDDILIGAAGANPNARNSGQTYVVFGDPNGPFPQGQLIKLIAEVKGLEIGQHSLINALDAAIEAFDQGRLNRAAGRLKAFIRQVEALRGGEISHADADALTAQADVILSRLISGLLARLEELITVTNREGLDIAKRPRHELLKDLDVALEALAKGRVNRAANLLEAFTFHVMVLGDDQIAEADAGALITQAEALLERLLSGPVASFENLIIKVKAAGLERRLEHHLVNHVDTAVKAFKQGRINRSANMLGVFIDHVAALRGSKIAPADADAFITQAERILDGLR